MRQISDRSVVLLVDFDEDPKRLSTVLRSVPADLAERVFVLGAWTEPEALKQAGLGSYESIGRAMADDCRNHTRKIWSHELLKHNEGQLDRLCQVMSELLK